MGLKFLSRGSAGGLSTIAENNQFVQNVVANAADNDLPAFCTLPAGFLTLGNKIIVSFLASTICGPNGSTYQVRLKLGGTTIIDPGATIVVIPNVTRSVFTMAEFFLTTGGVVAGYVGAPNYGAGVNAVLMPVTINTAAALTVAVSINWNNVEPLNSITVWGFSVWAEA